MQDYGPQIRRCDDVIRLAEQVGDERLAETTRELRKSFKEWEKD